MAGSGAMQQIKLSAEPPQEILSLTPSDFRIQCVLNQEISYTLTLHNKTDSIVAYKVKTTAPARYKVRPKQGFIGALKDETITIILSKLQKYPNPNKPKNLRDKFLVQSLVVDSELPDDELLDLWKRLEKVHSSRHSKWAFHEHKLRCRLVVPMEEQQQKLVNHPAQCSEPEEPNVEPSLESFTEFSNGTSRGDKQPSALPVPEVVEASEAAQPLPPAEPTPTNHNTASVPEPPKEEVSKVHIVKPDILSDKPHGSTNLKNSTPPTTARTSSKSQAEISPSMAVRTIEQGLTDINKSREYNKILSYSVKLTAEREALDAKLLKLKDQNESLTQENENLRKAFAELKTTSSRRGSEAAPPTLIDAIGDVGLRQRNPRSGVPLLEDSESVHALSEPAAGSGVQLWHLLLVAAICFQLGRFFC